MLTLAPETLSEHERETWSSYKHLRTHELKKLKPDLRDSVANSVAWFEFLRSRWVFSCSPPVDSIDPLEYARSVDEHGPDIRTIRARMSDNHRRPVQAPRKADSPVSPRFNNAYTFFVRRRFRELASEGTRMRVSEVVPMLAKEWASLTPEQREEVRAECDH